MKEIWLNQSDPNFKFEVANRLGGESLKACFACGACTGACPVKGVNDDFDPRKIIRMILLGLRKEVLGSKLIWYCCLCNTCSFVCPQDVKFSQVMGVLREMAIEDGFVHPSLQDTMKNIDRFFLDLRQKVLFNVLDKKDELIEFDLKEFVKSLL
ncbi:MAG: 4Fe-4S dicluster domain-containing protein [Candidatus Desulfofervidaceae bacterium]|nr:4Fe-4S dicluster domain-containing protein [Candidatus Desulfofervidaceae bacterium]MDL1970171.1 4Fe-4S dicluster domain-containing protein [Candidatus Desulfofervidaceae bacterium]